MLDASRRAPTRRWRRIAEALALVLLALVGWRQFLGQARTVPGSGDESQYVATSRYFAALAHPFGPEWGDNYWTHTQPMLTRFLVGGWLSLRGYDLDAMNQPYNFSMTPEQNRAAGQMPTPDVLLEARTPMVAIAVASILLLYLVVRLLGGVLAALATAALALASPFVQRQLPLVLPQAPVAFFVLLTLLLALLGARRGRGGSIPPRWALALAVALGLGVGTKLTVVMSALAIVAWALLVAIAAARRAMPAALRAATAGVRARRAARGWLVAVSLAWLVFVVSDPHLYSDPLRHSFHLARQRVQEMHDQTSLSPAAVLHTPLDRLRYVTTGTFVDTSAGGAAGVPVEAALALLGGLVIGARVWRSWRARADLPREALAPLTLLAYYVVTALEIHEAWGRYLVPNVFLALALGGVGIAQLLRLGQRLVRGWRLSTSVSAPPAASAEPASPRP